MRKIGLALTQPSKMDHTLYLRAFPPEERRRWNRIPWSDSAFFFRQVQLMENGVWQDCGFITTWNFDCFTYVEHFAIHPRFRGLGIGSQVLGLLENNIVLEVEPPGTSPHANTRIDFYQRNGFSLLKCNYIQPPYSRNLPEVSMKLMGRGTIPDPATIASILRTRVYGVLE